MKMRRMNVLVTVRRGRSLPGTAPKCMALSLPGSVLVPAGASTLMVVPVLLGLILRLVLMLRVASLDP